MVDRQEHKEKKSHKVPQSIISFYSKYQNKKSTLKSFLVMGTRFDVEDRYEVIDSVGQGAYGIVVAARDKQAADPENELVAIKKIEKAFEHKIFAKRTLRELKILRLLKHENVIGIKTILLPKSREHFDDIYVVSELMETDLAQIIRSPQPLSDEHCQFFMYQILRGLKYIHSANIMHRDLKPRNLLVNSNCDLKICDFGLARALDQKQKADVMTDYVATRWYRAPELLLSWKDYTSAVDVWSVGCIFAELLKRKPFLPGSDTRNQLELIFDVIGTPTEEEINSIPREKSRKLVRSLPKKKPKQLETLFPNASPIAIDLLKKIVDLRFH
jgi:serine/threonine protein kinase